MLTTRVSTHVSCTTVVVHPRKVDGITAKGCALPPRRPKAAEFHFGCSHPTSGGETTHGGRVPGITGRWILNGPGYLQHDRVFAELRGEADELVSRVHLDLVRRVEIGKAQHVLRRSETGRPIRAIPSSRPRGAWKTHMEGTNLPRSQPPL